MISKEDFFDTYKDGSEKVLKYLRAMVMVAEDIQLKDIVVEVSISRKGLYK